MCVFGIGVIIFCMKIPSWWRKIAAGILFFLFLWKSELFPLLVFLGLILFITSDSGKKLLGKDEWGTSDSFSDTKKRKQKEILVPHSESEQDISPSSSSEKPQSTPPKDKPLFFRNIFSFFYSLTHKKSMNIHLQKKQTPPLGAGMIGLAIVGVIALAVIADGVVSVPAGHTGVIFSRVNGGIQETTLNEGFNFKVPFLETATIISTRIQEKTINQQRDPITALTQDGQRVDIDMTVQYRIARESAPKLFQEIGMDYEGKVITPAVRSVVREVITGYDSKELFEQKARTKAENEIVEKLKSNYAQKYITLEDALIRNVKFSDKYLDTIEEKKIAEQVIEKSEFEKQNALIQKEKKIIEAEAEAESIKLRGEALESNPEVIQLQFVEKMAPQINWGILPDGAIPMINTESLIK